MIIPTKSSALAIFSSVLFALIARPAASARVYVLDFEETAPAGKLSVKAIPPTPHLRVSDEGGILPLDLRAEAEIKLAETPENPVFLVIGSTELPEGVEPETYANELLRRWAKSNHALSGIVFTVPKPLAAIHIALAGQNLSDDDKNRLRDIGNETLSAMPSQAPFAEAAASAALGLRERLAITSPTRESGALPAAENVSGTSSETLAAVAAQPVVPAPSSRWEGLARTINWQTVRLLSSIVGGILVATCTFFLLRRLMNRRGLVFPDHLPRKRFSAPFAGGSNAQVSYRQ